MWSNTFATPLVLRPEPSRRLARLLLILHGVAAAGLLMSSIAVGLLALPPLIASLCLHLRAIGWLGGQPAVMELRVERDGTWRILEHDGTLIPVRVAPLSFCHPALCVLRLHGAGRWHVLALAGDSAGPDELRRLRIHMLIPDSDRTPADMSTGAVRRALDILRGRFVREVLPMPTEQERLEALISDDPAHVYSEQELDAIEAIDPEMALRIDRVQTLARRQGGVMVADGPIDEGRVREAVEEARRILMQDGGDIEFLCIEDRTVRVRLKGACVGCPRSTLDLRNVVERLVRDREPGVARVVNEF